MIQRIQTIWLLVTAVLFGIEYWPALSFASTMSPGEGIFADSLLKTSEDSILSGACLTSALMALIAVFLYKNRESQLIVSALSGLIQAVAFIGWGFYLLYKSGLFQQFRADFALYSGMAGIFVNWLATRAIRKDAALVKSMDRLR